MNTSPLLTAAELGTILSIWAHPDDETYLSAGLMAAAIDNGQCVVCVSATAGELGTTDAQTWPPERLGQVRRWEAAAAMAVLGVREHRVLGLPDGALDHHDELGLDMVGRLLDELRPDTILTFGPDGMTFHPDHIAVHRWVTDAWEQRGRRSRLLYATPTVEHIERFGDLYEEWNMYMTDERPTGIREDHVSVHIRLDGAQLDRKLTALRALATQTTGLMATLDPAIYAAEVADEAFVDAFRLGARSRPTAPAAPVRAPAVSAEPAPAVGVRDMLPDDVEAVVELSLRAWEPVFASFRDMLGDPLFERFYPDWRRQQAADVRNAIAKNHTAIGVCDGTVAGFVNVIFTPDEASGEIYMIAVDPPCQRRGVAAALTSWALDEMRSRGMTLATVGTGADPGHAPARRAYESAGFTPWPNVLYVQLLDSN